MTDAKQREAAKHFSTHWKNKGYEKGESQPFWLSLLRDVYGVEHPEEFIFFEAQVHLDNTSFIDGFIPSTRVLIEQKGLDKDMKKPIKQSDGTLLTPFQQAKRYITELPVSKHPRWVVTCNFSSFYVYDMERPGGEPEEILLENLPSEYYRLSFLTDTGNVHLQREMDISIRAGEIVGILYDAFLKQYGENPTEDELKSLNVLCVRLVFCLYAEDAGIFGRRSMFHDYLASFDTHHTRKALIELFQTLDTLPENREKFLENELAEFPYVNGGLFADEQIEVPPFTDEMRDLLLNKASADFNWSEISPTIFGAVFESTLNPETRRSGGMHYTSIENIHKVINPLFLSELDKELSEICDITISITKEKRLKEFQKKLASLTFLDPACGSGNFLTETYLCLRRLENTVIAELQNGQIVMGWTHNPIKVTIGQFYGIEINDFAVTVAKTALWIAESQMMKATEDIVLMTLDFLPLKSYANIVEGNALRLDWESVVPKHALNYIMGNPPFVGYSNQSVAQKYDILQVCGLGKVDYVAAWYFVAAKYIQGTNIKCAFVSTNSITQGEQVATIWKPLYEKYGTHINFGVQTFKWSNEAKSQAAVHCVIVGFSLKETDNDLNPYLLKAPTVFIDSRSKPLCTVPEMQKGNIPVDGGNLIIEEAEFDDFVAKEPQAVPFIKPLVGATEYINNKKRYCLWLVDVSPTTIRQMPEVLKRVEQCRKFRLSSTKEATRRFADCPTRFMEIRQPTSEYILVPRHSSEKRRYIPFGFLDENVITTDANSTISNASSYHFGVLISNVHMAWVRAVCGRIKSDYRYSNDIVYNNFPWPEPSDVQKATIEQTAQAILDARAKYPDCSLADLYGETMWLYPELLTAHQNNDRAVMQAYGFSVKDMTESACVAELMKLYQAKVLDGKSPAH